VVARRSRLLARAGRRSPRTQRRPRCRAHALRDSTMSCAQRTGAGSSRRLVSELDDTCRYSTGTISEGCERRSIAERPYLFLQESRNTCTKIRDPLREQRPDLSPGLEAIVERCLQRLPNERYPSVEAPVKDLAPFTLPGPIPASEPMALSPLLAARPVSRRWIAATGGLFLALALTVAVGRHRGATPVTVAPAEPEPGDARTAPIAAPPAVAAQSYTMIRPDDYPGNYEVYGSPNGTTFDSAPIASGRGTANATVISFPQVIVSAVNIKQVGTANSIHWWGICEFQVACQL